MLNSAKGLFALIAAVVGVIASVIGIMVGVQQLRGNDNPGDAAVDTDQPVADDAAGATTPEAAAPESTWAPENTGAQLVLTTVYDAAGDCQYLHVDFDAPFEGTLQPTAASGLHAEASDDLIWNPCENGDGIYVASLTSAGTTSGAALDAASPSPEDCMDAVNAAGGANALLDIKLSFADDGLTGLSAGTSLCLWNSETSRLTIAASEGIDKNDANDRTIDYWVTTYLQG